MRGVPFDRYGPDPNGMIAPDGHRIKCKLQDDYGYRYATGLLLGTLPHVSAGW